MKKFISGTLSILLSLSLSAQNDNQAKQILESSSAKNNAYKTIKADFTFISTNPQSEKVIKETGKIFMKGDRYKLILPTYEITFDGKDIYNYLKEANEINITKPEPSKKEKGDFFFSNPRDIFKTYGKDFKSKLLQTIDIGAKSCYEIDLYPIDLKTKYSRIRLHIDKISLHIVDMKIFQKDGSHYLLEFSNFSPNSPIADSEFQFDAKKYPKAEVNDMRF